MVMGMVITIFMTRAIFLGLDKESYGFWALSWSVFGYSLLLDFGFGASIQKYTSETIVTKDWDKFNRVVSTVFFNYVFLGLIIILAAFILGLNIQHIFKFDPANRQYYYFVFLVFGFGTAVTFPFGFFTEVLRGMQALHIRNTIQAISMILNFIGIIIVVKLTNPLIKMAVVSIGISLLTNLAMAGAAFYKLRKMRISPKFYDKSIIKQVMGFSMYAYLITFTNLIIFRTDQMVISIFSSVALVGIYQISSRLAETYRGFASQFLDNLSPVAASLNAAGHHNKLAEIMLQSNRLMGMISTMMLIPLIVYVKPLLQIWLELSDPMGTVVAVILLLSMYNLLFFRSSSVYILLMLNKQKTLTKIALIECLANLGLSILLLKTLPVTITLFGISIDNFNIVGVALGTFIPNVVLAFTYNVPAAIKFSGLSIKEYFNISIRRTLVIGLIVFVLAEILYRLRYPGKLLEIVLYTFIIGIIYGILTWFIGLEGWEKKQVVGFVNSKIKARRS
jgi:O-antigen/teichoic acid export membrane protein